MSLSQEGMGRPKAHQEDFSSGECVTGGAQLSATADTNMCVVGSVSSTQGCKGRRKVHFGNSRVKYARGLWHWRMCTGRGPIFGDGWYQYVCYMECAQYAAGKKRT
jgi:hypothetical protein